MKPATHQRERGDERQQADEDEAAGRWPGPSHQVESPVSARAVPDGRERAGDSSPADQNTVLQPAVSCPARRRSARCGARTACVGHGGGGRRQRRTVRGRRSGSICAGRVADGVGVAAAPSSAAASLPPVTGEPFRKLSIFFPMWNEEAYIERAVGYAKDECELLVAAGEILDYELIVVDDASTDAPRRLADALAAADPHVKVVHHPVNRKLGGSIKTGFAAATGDLVLYSDADLPFDMAEVGQAVRLLRYYEADIVSAYRFDRTGEGSSRAIYTFFYNVLIRRLFGVRMRDINFAFKLCRAQHLRAHRAAERGLVHRRRAHHPGQEAGLRRHPVRRRLLPAHPWREHAGLGSGHQERSSRDVRPAQGTVRPSARRRAEGLTRASPLPPRDGLHDSSRPRNPPVRGRENCRR